MQDFKYGTININDNEDSIPIERKLSSLISMKLFGSYNKTKRTKTNRIIETDNNCIKIEKELLNCDSDKLILETKFEGNEKETIEKINNSNPLNLNTKIPPISEVYQDNIENRQLSKEKIENKFKDMRSSLILKRRNNIFLSQTQNFKEKRHNYNRLCDENNANKFNSENIDNIEHSDYLKRINEKREDKSQSILINFPPQINGNVFNRSQANVMKRDSLNLNESNRNIKKFIKRNNLSISEKSITNNSISEYSEEAEINLSSLIGFEGKNLNKKKLNIIKGQLFEKYETKKKSSINKLDPTYFQILCSTFCLCKAKVRRENLFLDECQKLMGNYLDYLSIIRFLKEFDRLKKILFSDSQLKLFSYLPKANLRFKNDQLKIDSLYGDIFLDKKEKNKKDNIHIQYSKLFDSYVKLLGQSVNCETNKKINKRMIIFMDKDMKCCFEDVVNNYLEQITQ
jgi:hypothetical protein